MATLINRKFFFDTVRQSLFAGKLSPNQAAGLTAIIDEWEARKLEDDRWLAYMLATAYHETARTMAGINEYGKGKGRPYSIPHPLTKKVYYGRGLVQLTWYDNYLKMGKILGIDLAGNPDLALSLPVAVKIMYEGMIRGTFTGKALKDYFCGPKEDWVNARRIINGTDRAAQIADIGLAFLAGISRIARC